MDRIVTLAFFRRPRRRQASRERPALGISSGYSLAEVLIVLVILGMILGFSGMKFDSYRTQQQLVNEARLLQGHLQSLQLASLRSRRSTVIDAAHLEGLARADASKGDLRAAAVTVDAAVRIAVDGSCSPGRYSMTLGSYQYALSVSAPLCDSTIARVK